MGRIRPTHIMALLLAMILTGCISEKEPNNSTAEAQANNAPPLFEPGASQGALFLGTKEANGEDNWLIGVNAPTTYHTLSQLGVKSTNGQCLDFHIWYCFSLVNSWDSCQQIGLVGDIWQVCDDQPTHYSPIIDIQGQHWIRVQAVGSGAYSNSNAEYSFSFTNTPAP
jgi:hypothetical protein